MVRILIPSGALTAGVAARPDLIAIDGGSTDSGPHYLGTGTSKYARSSTKAEWRALMAARARAGVPLVIGTAGTCGADAAVDWMVEITREIAAETGEQLKLAVLKSGQSAESVATALEADRIRPLPPERPITPDLIRACTNIVALAGAEQVGAALATGADIVICGRTTDTAIISALPLMRGCHAGAAWHGAKIGECGALCTTNPQTGVIQIDFDGEGFTVTPMAETARATPHTVSAHMLYENSDPFILHEPGGHLDVTGARYAALDDRRVRVTGSRWVPSDRYTVKLEGARVAGHQSVTLALLRDPRYVANAAQWADDLARRCTAKARARLGRDDFTIELRLIGLNATLGALETARTAPCEIGVLAIATAPTEALAREAARMLNPYLLHHPLTEQEELPTFAFPFSPAEMHRGRIHEFCLHHVMELDDPMQAFRLEVFDIG
ncbi:acyclic terpene utilization AtuA family protein [Jhaorihella thermophila]|uniref:Acyclic terpene utilisation N-terminal domain-containing protein n=1 Tax=Jhaorihella thermophila TaxID=488547 RepID=A0A1H5TJL9_9RHOB|nr:acyclic terpene utilization AtuA family protein [Jhaorihella thermophila]SEF62964.1 Protein of unknown function [Jhaorihella thermophila]